MNAAAPHPALTTPLTSMLGCRHPIIQTAMGWVATSDLVIASIKAGAFGFLAAAVMRPEECEAEIRRIKDASDAPFGVNFHAFQPGADKIVDIIIDHGIRAVSYGRAPSEAMIAKLKRANVLCIPTIGAGKHAKKAVALGADALVCQGQEGGGHTGFTPTWLLLSQVMDAVDVPVAPAGGFKDGRGLAAALTFGADGVAMGTRFMMTADSPTPGATKNAYLSSDVGRIPVSTKLDGLPQRMIMNDTLARLERSNGLEMLLRALMNGWKYKEMSDASMVDMVKTAWTASRSSDLTFSQTMMAANAPVIIKKSMIDGKPEEGVLPSGQVAGLIDDLPTCAELIAEMVAQAEERLRTVSAPFPKAAE
ncbi:MAG: nitronate monooxygenase [Pseudomonadota bacterium]